MEIALLFFHELGKAWVIWATDDSSGADKYWLVGGQTNFAGLTVLFYN